MAPGPGDTAAIPNMAADLLAPTPVAADSYESPIVPASDTASASSEDFRDVDGPSTSRHLQKQFQLQHQLQRKRTSQEDHSWQLTASSDTDSAHIATKAHSPANSLSSLPSEVSDAGEAGDAVDSSPALFKTLTSAVPVSDSASAPVPAPLSLRSPIKRKPLSSSASSLAAALPLRDSTAVLSLNLEDPLPKPHHRFARSPSIDSPTFYEYPPSVRASLPSCPSPVAHRISTHSVRLGARNIPVDEPEQSYLAGLSDDQSVNDKVHLSGSSTSPTAPSPLVLQSDEDIARSESQDHLVEDSYDDVESLYADHAEPASSPPMFAPKPTPPHLKLDTVDSAAPRDELESNIEIDSPNSARLEASPQLNKPLPKSPSQASPFATIFGWTNPSPSATEFSSIPSPISPSKNVSTNDAPRTLGSNSSISTTITNKSNAATSNPIGYCESYLSTPPPGATSQSHQIDEMEDELKAISSELAASIRREMDLEDLVERLQEQVNNPQAPGKRSSDYFSDSGYSSAKVSEYDQSRDEIEKIQRRSEQEKASIRVELSDKLQDERSRRKTLEQQIKELSEKASQMDLAHMNNLDANDRVRELEKSCEDLRRRLNDERESKTNFEDLLSGLKSELQETCNERDNLRDEVVPQLRARVEGLEAQAASYANLTYESTKMQHQLQSLKKENTSLRNSFGSPEDIGLSRSNSTAAYRFPSLSRSDSVKNVQSESREALAERLKDVEAQRDALHNALKNLLERQEFQNRENQKKIKILEVERQRLLLEPRKAGFDKEISSLRTEINVLRRRAEDALEQKWQVEKGLGGLKMDLDRAEEEIASLRSLLQEKDILIPPGLARSSGGSDTLRASVTSASLQQSYKDLQKAYTESLERIKKLELNSSDATSNEKTKLAVQRLEQSLSAAISERDAARRHLDGLKTQVNGLSAGESQHIDREKALSEELTESAHRVEQLAAQVQQQLAANSELRKRLADTVTRGDSERKANSERITELQALLHSLEEQLVAAQTASEERVGRHEDELAHLREAHNEQLRRINNGAGVGVTARNASLLSPVAPKAFGRPGQPIPSKSFEEDVEIKTLRTRVTELETAVADAESEIQQVVAKMNEAQIEVMNLQEERETAARETRRLQKVIEQAKLVPLSGRA